LRLRVEREPDSIGETRQIVEDPDDVHDLEAGAIVEAEPAQRLPVVLGHAGRGCRELFGNRTELAVPLTELELAPAFLFDGTRELGIAAFDTQKLCV